MDSKIIPFPKSRPPNREGLDWDVCAYPWGTVVVNNKTGKIYDIFLYPDAQPINVEHLEVILHHNGIEFC
jgi:hypothetical protein